MRIKNVAKWVAGCLILTAVVWGLIIYGPGIWETVQKRVTGSSSVRDVVEHPDKYLGTEIAVRGLCYGGSLWEIKPETGQYWVLLLENLPADAQLIEGGTYEAIGTLRYGELEPPWGERIYLDVKTIKPI